VILERLEVTGDELRERTGWDIRPEGACKADRCVPLPEPDGELVDVRVLAERLDMALVHDEAHDLWALGPESGERVLLSAELPEITLPDRHGNPFSLSALHGKKVLLVAWASW
jgi:hypothetical protein